MPEILTALLPAAAEAGLELGGEALLGGALDAGASAALSGAAEVGSGAALNSIFDLGTSALTGAAAPALVGGAAEVGAGAAGGGLDLTGLLTTTGGDAALPDNAILNSGADLPFSFGGISSVGAGADNMGAAAAGALPGGGEAVMSVPGVTSAGVGAGAAGAASAAPPAAAGPLDLTSLLGKAGSSIANNPLGLALAAGGLGLNVMKGSGNTAATDRIAGQDAALKTAAGDIMNTGKGLTSHTEAGTLPPALQQQLDQQIKDAKTKMISTYAANGMNTDPNRNSMLRQELDSIDKRGLVTKGEMQKQLLASGATLINSGTALVGADNDLIKTLSTIERDQQKMIGSAIANFAQALSGKSPGLTLQLGGEKKAA